MHDRIATYLLVLLTVAAGAGCGGEPPPPRPTSEEIELVTEALVIEAVLQDFTGSERDGIAEEYYGQLYDKYGVEVGALSDLRARYSRHPELWVAAADSAAARIDRHRGDAMGLLTPAKGGGNIPADTLAPG